MESSSCERLLLLSALTKLSPVFSPNYLHCMEGRQDHKKWSNLQTSMGPWLQSKESYLITVEYIQ